MYSQTKEILTIKINEFDSSFELSEKFLKKKKITLEEEKENK